MRKLWALGLLLLVPAAARAAVSTSYKGTFGPEQYVGTNLDLDIDLPRELDLDLGYSSYQSDISSGTTKTYLGSFGWSDPKGSFHLNLSGTPEVNGYKRRSLGFDGSFRILNEGESEDPERRPIRAYLLAAYDHILHTDGTVSVQERVKRGTQTVTLDNDILENDYTIGTKIKVYGTTFTGKFIKSAYNLESFATARRAFSVVGAPQLQQGYPNQTFTAKINQDVTSWLWIYGSYSNEQYKFGQNGYADSYGAGAGLAWNILELTAEYNRYVPSDSERADYFSLGGTIRFGS